MSVLCSVKITPLYHINLIESFGLKQHVSDPNHRTGDTIDVVLTRDRDSLAPTVSSQDHCFPDHFPLLCDPSLTTEYSRLQEVAYRKIKAINDDCFIRDVNASALRSTSATTDLDADVALYNTTLSAIVHACPWRWCGPIQHYLVNHCQHACPWKDTKDSSAPATWMVQRGHPSGEAISPTGRETVAEDTPHSTPRHVQREMQFG